MLNILKKNNPELLLNKENGIKIHEYLNQKFSYDRLPKVVSEKEFEQLAKDKKVLYRGVTDTDEITGHEMAQQFKYGKFYAGKGLNGDGTYTTHHKDLAFKYATNDGTNKGEVIEMLLAEDAKIISFRELYADLDNPLGSEELGILRKYKYKFEDTDNFERVIGDIGRYGVIKGYDAIDFNGSFGWDHTLILNRGKLIVKK